MSFIINLIANLINSFFGKKVDGNVWQHIEQDDENFFDLPKPEEDEKDKYNPIIIDKRVREKYKGFIKSWDKKKRKKDPTEITIHGTAGTTTIEGLLNWMFTTKEQKRVKNYKKAVGLFHYLVGGWVKKDKKIAEVIPTDNWCYHSTSGWNDKKTIGVELINHSRTNRNAYKKDQYELLFWLIFDYLMVKYPSITKISSHRYNIWRWNSQRTAKKYDKNCPGNFDWNKLDEELRKRGYSFSTDGNLRYDIKKV